MAIPATSPEDGPIRVETLTKDTYAALVDRLFVLPLGIVEEHGPHLPLGTDTFQVQAVLDEAAAATGAVLLPPLWYGNCDSTRPFPGSISISVDTLRAVLEDILDELVRHGVRRVALVSGHAGSGHMAGMKLAAKAAIARAPALKVAVLSEWDFLFAGEGLDAAALGVPEGDGHAGTMETSRMLALRPELVSDERPGLHLNEEPPFVLDAHPEAWWPDGYGGDPSRASAEIGRALHDHCVEGLVKLFERMAAD